MAKRFVNDYACESFLLSIKQNEGRGCFAAFLQCREISAERIAPLWKAEVSQCKIIK
jgi:hypothetical protein